MAKEFGIALFRRARPTRFALASLLGTGLGLSMPAFAQVGAAPETVTWEPQETGRWYVQAAAPDHGDGSRKAPFNSLMLAQGWSKEGDSIVVLSSPIATPPLDGGIWLKPGQVLIGEGPPVTAGGPLAAAPRITNSAGLYNNGDAVVLSDRTSVRNVVIVDPHRSGIYGSNVTDVRVEGNDISGHNRSCAGGINIYPFHVFAVRGLPNGWAGIMIDSWTGTARAAIKGNVVRDADCGDGIDVRLMGSAVLTVLLEDNRIMRLKEGTEHGFRSLLAIGFQTGDASRLTARLDRNSQTDIGSPKANPEGVFANIGGRPVADIVIDNNRAHNLFGGPSANGVEIVMMQGSAHAKVRIANSSFTNITGDIIQQGLVGQGQVSEMEIENVTASHSANPDFPDLKLSEPNVFANGMACLLVKNTSPNFLASGGNRVRTVVRSSRFSDCAIGVVIASRRNQDAIDVTIEDSTFTRNRNGNMFIRNGDPTTAKMAAKDMPAYWGPGAVTEGRLGSLNVRVRRTDFGGAIAGANIYAKARPGTVGQVTIDLGTPNDPGGNNLVPGAGRAVEAYGLPVSAVGNWWGRASGPAAAAIAGQVNRAKPLAADPEAGPRADPK